MGPLGNGGLRLHEWDLTGTVLDECQACGVIGEPDCTRLQSSGRGRRLFERPVRVLVGVSSDEQ